MYCEKRSQIWCIYALNNQNRVTITTTALHLTFFMADCKIFYTVILSILLSAPLFFNIVKNVKSQKQML